MSDFVWEQDPNTCLSCGKISDQPLHQVRWVRYVDLEKQVYALTPWPMAMCEACANREITAKDDLDRQGYQDRSVWFAKKLNIEERT